MSMDSQDFLTPGRQPLLRRQSFLESTLPATPSHHDMRSNDHLFGYCVPYRCKSLFCARLEELTGFLAYHEAEDPVVRPLSRTFSQMSLDVTHPIPDDTSKDNIRSTQRPRVSRRSSSSLSNEALLLAPAPPHETQALWKFNETHESIDPCRLPAPIFSEDLTVDPGYIQREQRRNEAEEEVEQESKGKTFEELFKIPNWLGTPSSEIEEAQDRPDDASIPDAEYGDTDADCETDPEYEPSIGDDSDCENSWTGTRNRQTRVSGEKNVLAKEGAPTIQLVVPAAGAPAGPTKVRRILGFPHPKNKVTPTQRNLPVQVTPIVIIASTVPEELGAVKPLAKAPPRKPKSTQIPSTTTVKPKKGHRTGGLAPEAKKHAASTRKVGACHQCRKAGTKCDDNPAGCHYCVSRSKLCVRYPQFWPATLSNGRQIWKGPCDNLLSVAKLDDFAESKQVTVSLELVSTAGTASLPTIPQKYELNSGVLSKPGDIAELPMQVIEKLLDGYLDQVTEQSATSPFDKTHLSLARAAVCVKLLSTLRGTTASGIEIEKNCTLLKRVGLSFFIRTVDQLDSMFSAVVTAVHANFDSASSSSDKKAKSTSYGTGLQVLGAFCKSLTYLAELDWVLAGGQCGIPDELMKAMKHLAERTDMFLKSLVVLGRKTWDEVAQHAVRPEFVQQDATFETFFANLEDLMPAPVLRVSYEFSRATSAHGDQILDVNLEAIKGNQTMTELPVTSKPLFSVFGYPEICQTRSRSASFNPDTALAMGPQGLSLLIPPSQIETDVPKTPTSLAVPGIDLLSPTRSLRSLSTSSSGDTHITKMPPSPSFAVFPQNLTETQTSQSSEVFSTPGKAPGKKRTSTVASSMHGDDDDADDEYDNDGGARAKRQRMQWGPRMTPIFQFNGVDDFDKIMED